MQNLISVRLLVLCHSCFPYSDIIVTALLCVFLQACFSAISYGEHVLTAQQGTEVTVKKLEKSQANLQAALQANTAMEGELQIARGVIEQLNS